MKALIADDDPLARRLLDLMLRKMGYETVLCPDGTSAWEVMRGAGAPTLAIIDWLMPGIDGAELCKLIRRRSSVPYAYVLMVSSKSERLDVVEGMNAGADDYITKPIHQEELEARLRAGRRILELQAAMLHSREQLRDLAMRDALTGLLNRRAIIGALEREMLRVEHDRHVTAIVMADLDGFKAVNDTRGHLAGDTVLQEAAARLTSCVRGTDHVGRYGGEEFLLVLPMCTDLSARALVRRVLQRFQELPFDTAAGAVAVTLSLGVALAVSGLQSSAADLIGEADRAMYQSKRAGGNCASFHTSDAPSLQTSNSKPQAPQAPQAP